jgi:hypothetical protein
VELTAYLTLDGSASRTTVQKQMRFEDSVQLTIGNGGDLELSHDGSISTINNYVGTLSISQLADDGDIRFQSDNGAGGNATYFSLDGSAATHDGSATTALFTTWGDKSRIGLGDANDLQIYHDGSNSYIDDTGTGNLKIRSNRLQLEKYTGETMAEFIADGGSSLYYDNAKKIETVTGGVEITGNITVSGTVDGIDIATDVAANTAKETNVVQTTVTGNAGTATKLAATKTIAGVAFDGSANISLNNNAITNGAGYTTYAGPADGVEGTKGIVELASIEEATIGSDTAKAVTAAGVSAHVVGRKVHELTAPTAALAMNAQKITGVADPAAAQDAATKAYTDAKVWDGSDITSGTIAAARVATLNQNTTGLAGTATALATTRAIYGNNFDGSAAVTGTIATAYIADDAVTFAKASGVSPNIYGSTIKLIPSDFETSGDGGNTKFGAAFDKTAGEADYGMRTSDSTQEVFAFVSIPEGMKATHVEIYGRRTKNVEVFEVQINATTVVSKGTGTCTIPGGSSNVIAITNVSSTATNLLAIEVLTNSATADRIYGGTVTIAAI